VAANERAKVNGQLRQELLHILVLAIPSGKAMDGKGVPQIMETGLIAGSIVPHTDASWRIRRNESSTVYWLIRFPRLVVKNGVSLPMFGPRPAGVKDNPAKRAPAVG